jgi:hypothetical protein
MACWSTAERARARLAVINPEHMATDVVQAATSGLTSFCTTVACTSAAALGGRQMRLDIWHHALNHCPPRQRWHRLAEHPPVNLSQQPRHLIGRAPKHYTIELVQNR